MGKYTSRLERIRRELDRRAPAEPVVIEIVYVDDWRAPDERARAKIDYRLGLTAPDDLLDGRAPAQVIQLRWPEDDERQTRQDAPGHA